MINIPIDINEAMDLNPILVGKYVCDLKESDSKYNNSDIKDIRWFYTICFEFVDFNEKDNVDIDDLGEMLYTDRLFFEMEQLSIGLSMEIGLYKVGDSIFIGNEENIPEKITSMVEDVIGTLMVDEQKIFGNEEVVYSLPITEREKKEILDIYSSSENDEGSLYHRSDFHPQDIFGTIDMFEFNGFDIDMFGIEPIDVRELDIDEILDKISQGGVEILDEIEVNFLDNYDKKNKNK